jgi:hypothetical protein
MPTPEQLAQLQLDAYNSQDINAFMECYAPDVEVFTQGVSEPSYRDHADMRETYKKYFEANPNLHAALIHRIVQGRFVIDHERVTGRADGRDLRAVAIYEVIDGLIRRVWFIM